MFFKDGSITIGNRQITTRKAFDLIKMLCNDAKQVAGEYYDMDRSEKFRVNWPDQYRYVNATWKSFIKETRALYAKACDDPKTPRDKADDMYAALVLQAMMAKGEETDNRLQIERNTQQFIGDKAENRKTVEKFGRVPNLRAALMNSVASRH